MKNFILFLILCYPVLGLLAQDNAHQLLVKKTATSHQARWFPADYRAWAAGLEQGYQIERSTNGRDYTKVHSGLIRPAFSNSNRADQLLQNVQQFKDSLLILLDQNEESQKVINSLPREFQRMIAIESNGIQESGLFFSDQTAQANQKYWYRLRLGGGQILATVPPTGIKTEQALPQLEAIQQGEAIRLKWLQKRAPSSFQAFQLERQVENGSWAIAGADWRFPKAFPKQWNIQVDTFWHVDTIAIIGQEYNYRLRAVDAFGAVSESKAVSLRTKDLTPPNSAQRLTTQVSRKNQTVELQWKYPNADPDLHAFAVYRSIDPEHDYRQISSGMLSTKKRIFQDKIAEASGNYYYKIAALDKSGNIAWSLRASAYFPDKIPPSVPTGLVAQHDTMGQVSISWRTNPEIDIKGYFLTRGRFLDDEFVALTPNAEPGTLFTDTVPLHFVNREVFYKIAAADDNGNVSAYSAPVKLILPDTIAPVAPVLRPIVQTAGNIELSWLSGKEEDLNTVKIFRKKSEGDNWNLIQTISSTQTSTQDTKLDAETGHWMYRLQAVDENGNHSKFSNERVVRLAAPAVMVNPIQRLEGDYRPKAKGIVLEWVHLTKSSARYLVFRRENQQDEPILITQHDTTRFFDAEVQTGREYTYFIIVQTMDGTYSEPSVDIVVSTL